MATKTVTNGRIELFRFIDEQTCEQVTTNAVLPESMHADWNGSTVYLLNWKITDGQVRIEYQTRNEVCAPILDCTLGVEQIRTKLTPPNRSKNWRWNTFDGAWRNIKTGERVKVW